MQNLALLLTGYSVFYAISLALTHFRCENYGGQRFSQIMGMVLIALLAGLQLVHFLYLVGDADFVHGSFYIALLFGIAPAFYLFSKPLLKAEASFRIFHLLHFLPIIIAFFIPHQDAFALAFVIGGLYLLWLAKSIYALRKQRLRFHLELIILGIVFIIAVAALIFGLLSPRFSEQLFYSLYASAIGFAFLLINLALSYTPQISNKLVEAARETYATSTLSNINCEARLKDLDILIKEKKLYQESNLDLHTLATELDLSSHQLSELMNTRLGKSFSRYIREQRINAAKEQLKSEPASSVLSVGLSVGFTSQSNFYDAFREIVGTTPGKYRKLQKTV